MYDFLSFEKFITPSIIRIVYIIGLVLIVLGTLIKIFAAYTGFISGLIVPIILMFLFGLLWRVYCEIVLVFFDMRDKLAAIASRQPPIVS
jgi:hypothetical protein